MPVVPPVDMGLRSPSKYPELEQLRHLNVLYFHGEPLPLDDLPLWITSWKWYKYHGRFLDPDEVLGMMNIYYKLDPLEPRLPSGMIELFDDNTSQMTIALESLKSEHYHVLVGQAGYLFEKLQENHHSKIKAQILLGLVGRMPDAPFMVNTGLTLCNKPLQLFQTFIAYSLLHWCFDGEDRRPDPDMVTIIFSERYHMRKRSRSLIFQKLANQDFWLTEQVAGLLTNRTDLQEFFGMRAFFMLQKFDEDSSIGIPSSRRRIASPSDIDPLSPALAGRQLEEEVKEEWEEGSEEEWEEDEDEDEEPEPEPKRKGKQKGKGPAYPHNIFS